MPVRIYDLAKKLGIESKLVLAKAKELGMKEAKVPSSSLDKITAEYLEEKLVVDYPQAASAVPVVPVAPPPPPVPIVVISEPVIEPEPPIVPAEALAEPVEAPVESVPVEALETSAPDEAKVIHEPASVPAETPPPPCCHWRLPCLKLAKRWAS